MDPMVEHSLHEPTSFKTDGLPSSDLSKMTEEETAIRSDTFEGHELPPLNNQDDEKSGSEISEGKAKADGEDEKMVTLTYNSGILFSRRYLEVMSSLSYEPEDNDEDNEIVSMKVHVQLPTYIIEVDGCRADALDFFLSQGVVIAYYKRADGSIAWKQHGPHAEGYGLIGSFELKGTTLEKLSVQQEEWETALPEEVLEKNGMELYMLRNDWRGMSLIYMGQDGGIEFDLREGKHNDPQGHFVYVAEDKQLKSMSG